MDSIILIARVLLGFVRLSNDALIGFVRNVVVMMTDNENYKAPAPDLPAITKALDLLDTLAHQAMTGDRLKISQRPDSRRDLITLIRQLPANVQCHCQDNRSILFIS